MPDFRAADFFGLDFVFEPAFFEPAFFLDPVFPDPDFFRPPEPDSSFGGTFAPSFLASDSPMAIAWRRLVTFLPELLLSCPRFCSCTAFPTFSEAFGP